MMAQPQVETNVTRTLVHRVKLEDVVKHYINNFAIAANNALEERREAIIDVDSSTLIITIDAKVFN